MVIEIHLHDHCYLHLNSNRQMVNFILSSNTIYSELLK